MAARDFIHNRQAALESLQRAASAYQRILQTTDNERLVNRAHLGLARIHEMQNELEKSREEYLKVTGGYARYAREQAERLETPEAKETYAWLATAQAPRPRVPVGPGLPGQQPDFSTDDFPLPGETKDTDAADGASAESFDDVLKRFNLGFPESDEADRYKSDEQVPAVDEPPAKAADDVKSGDPSEPGTEEKSAE
jgi:hypothetical protein